jgi:hypothetical protein
LRTPKAQADALFAHQLRLEIPMLRRVLVPLFMVAIALPLSGQRLEQTRVAAHRASTASFHGGVILVGDTARAEPSNGALMALAGIMFGAAGALAGGALGYSMETSRGCESEMFCGLGGALLGGFIGEAIGLPIGVHIASKRRHPLEGKIGRSLGASLIGIGAAFVTQGYGLFFIPPLQLMFTMSPEFGAGHAAAR